MTTGWVYVVALIVIAATSVLVVVGIAVSRDDAHIKWVEQDGKVCVIYDGDLHCRPEGNMP